MLLSLSRLQVTISCEVAPHVLALKAMRADLENLTLSAGVRNMSDLLPAKEDESEVK